MKALEEALALNRRAIRRLQEQARQEGLSVARGGLTPLSVRKVLAVYSMSVWRADLALLAAKQLSRFPKHHVHFPDITLIQSLFLAFDLADLLAMYDDEHSAWARARQFSRKFLAEFQAWDWVKAQNVRQGVAPTGAEVFEKYTAAEGKHTGERASRRTVRKWAARWHARWGVRRGRLRATDQIDVDGLKAKAPLQ